ncbi:SGNH/GDSL hydrolase family protein [Saccharothrix longispora]|uniref:SGNH/GDSL hydrolase family protein n=1 Tax=Saccharothrix longispora TaxID=33920 RepID=UPI0028FD4146|nr:SGNH/GDSL hydrolase family protein [Saccharothrix longispora]MDU0293524.1 SGNH/GDSL hydrolase family protein [Saccharothrix longispora]
MKTIVVALLMVLATAPPAWSAPAVPEPAALELVSLGDSYAAGLGAGDEAQDDCRRSPHAYPNLLASRTGATLVTVACSQATTVEVTAQADRVTPETGLVTVQAGGNDAGFKDVMITCTLSDDQGCRDRVATAEAFIRGELPGRLDALYGKVRDRLADRANGRADVVVVGYPKLFSFDSWCLMTGPKREALNHAVDVITEVTAARAEAAGFRFADVRDEFDGHGACAADPWVHGLVLVPVDRSYHPNRAGHASGYLPAVAALAGSAA